MEYLRHALLMLDLPCGSATNWQVLVGLAGALVVVAVLGGLAWAGWIRYALWISSISITYNQRATKRHEGEASRYRAKRQSQEARLASEGILEGHERALRTLNKELASVRADLETVTRQRDHARDHLAQREKKMGIYEAQAQQHQVEVHDLNRLLAQARMEKSQQAKESARASAMLAEMADMRAILAEMRSAGAPLLC